MLHRPSGIESKWTGYCPLRHCRQIPCRFRHQFKVDQFEIADLQHAGKSIVQLRMDWDDTAIADLDLFSASTS